MPIHGNDDEELRVAGIGALSSGPEDFYLISSQLVVDGADQLPGSIVDIDPAAVHVVGLRHTVGNRDPRSFGDPIGVWRTCTTVYNETDRKPVSPGFDTEQADGGQGGGLSEINVGKITKPTQFRIKLWANQSQLASPPASTYW